MSPGSTVTVAFVGLMLFGQVNSEKVVKAFTSLYSGNYSDAAQKEDFPDRDLMEVTIRPVRVKGMEEKTTLYFDERVNRKLLRCWIMDVSEVDPKTVQVAPMNITNQAKCRPNLGDFSDISQADLAATKTEYKSTLNWIKPDVFSGDWPNYRFTVDGQMAAYLITIDCDGMIVGPPVGAQELSSAVPYVMKRTGPRINNIYTEPSYN